MTHKCHPLRLITRTLVEPQQESKDSQRPRREHPSVKNTYVLQTSEKMNRKQMTTVSTIRSHSVQAFCSSLPDGGKKKKKEKEESESVTDERNDRIRASESWGSHRRCQVVPSKSLLPPSLQCLICKVGEQRPSRKANVRVNRNDGREATFQLKALFPQSIRRRLWGACLSCVTWGFSTLAQ